jgi:pantoate--beta-alanine ligase
VTDRDTLTGVQVLTTIAETRRALDEVRRDGGTVGLVPTMGYLHDGHLSLMAAARADTDVVVATVFVNPLQFAPGEDLATYPRDPEGDRAKTARAGVDLLFSPEPGEMYPEPVLTTVSVDGLSQTMEGASRPTHFAGVATVVVKLFAIAGPCRAYFGEKDFQQLAVVRRMVADLSLPVEVVGCPIVRAADGLALSSRNAYLTPEEREAAPVLARALRAGAASVLAGERDPAVILALVGEIIAAEPLAETDYVALVDPVTLQPPPGELEPGSYRLLTAARFGIPRLIDNLTLSVPG